MKEASRDAHSGQRLHHGSRQVVKENSARRVDKFRSAKRACHGEGASQAFALPQPARLPPEPDGNSEVFD